MKKPDLGPSLDIPVHEIGVETQVSTYRCVFVSDAPAGWRKTRTNNKAVILPLEFFPKKRNIFIVQRLGQKPLLGELKPM